MSQRTPNHRTLPSLTALWKSRLCLKTLCFGHLEITLYKSHSDHSTKVLGRLLKPSEHTPALFQPADQTLNDVAIPVRFLVEYHRPGVTVFVGLRRNDRLNSKVKQILVNPVGAIAFVSGQCHRPSNRGLVVIEQMLIRVDQYVIQGRCFMGLPSGHVERQRMALSIAKQMDFAA